jgi:WD40 repeat protein/mono/diheme cytochrome c family protein
MHAVRPCISLLGLLAATGLVLGSNDPVPTQSKESSAVSYYRDVRRIFQQNCQGCHQPAKAQGGYDMTSHAALLKKGESGEPGVMPSHPDQSKVIEQIIPRGKKRPPMPKGMDPLSGRDVEVIRQWITQGARDDTPAVARELVNAEHPPVYALPPVITYLAYSPDSKLLAVTGYHEVLIHDANGGGLVARLVGLSERVESLAFSPDGKSLAVSGGDPGRFGEVQIWDIARRKLKLSVPVTFDTVYGVSWSRDGLKVAFGCADNTLRAIDARNGQQVLFQGAHNDWVLDTVFSTDASHLVSVSRDMSMKLTEVATQRFVDNITSITPGALKGGLMTVDRHPKKDELLAGGSDGQVKIYRMYRQQKRVIGDDFNLIRAFESMPGRIFRARYNAAGSRVIVGSSSEGHGEVRIYDEATGKLVATLEGERGPVFAVAYRPDGKQVASAGFDGIVRLNDPQSGKLIKEFLPYPTAGSTASVKR